MGVGTDIMNLAAVINFDQGSSPIVLEQVAGRLRDRKKKNVGISMCVITSNKPDHS